MVRFYRSVQVSAGAALGRIGAPASRSEKLTPQAFSVSIVVDNPGTAAGYDPAAEYRRRLAARQATARG